MASPERTPQDVLRELRREIVDKALSRPDPFKPATPYKTAIYDVLELFDKAIAEASEEELGRWNDSENMAASLAYTDEVVEEQAREAPDTLSEKPGLDVERLLRAMYGALPYSNWTFHAEENAFRVAAEYERLHR